MQTLQTLEYQKLCELAGISVSEAKMLNLTAEELNYSLSLQIAA